MSTQQSVDPNLMEQTRQHVRNLVREITQLSKQELSPHDYYTQFLNRVVEALSAMGGAVWTLNEGGGFELQYQINLRDTRLAETEERLKGHGALLQKALASPEGLLVAPQSGGGEDGAENPTDFLLVLCPVKADQDNKGVVEIFHRPGALIGAQRGWLRFLLDMCDLAGDYLKTRQLRHFTDRQTLWSQLENFTRAAHASLDPREAAYTIANEGRRLIECDRVSVAIKKGRKCHIEAVSGQDTFDRRSNTISLLNRLATAVVASGDPLWYSGDTSNLAPQVEDAVQEYVDDSHSKNVAVLPLRKPVSPTADEKTEGETIGALIIELIEDARPKEGMVQRVNVVSEHSALALANSLEHQNLFLMPLWRTLGKARWIVSARTLPKTVAVVLAVVGLISALVFVPADFNLTGDGRLLPKLRKDVFAGIEGTIDEVLVKQGDQVEEGQVLAVLRNTNLDIAEEKVTGEIKTSMEELLSVKRKGKGSGAQKLTAEERDQLSSQESQLTQRLVSLNEQLRLHGVQREKLQITSPISGQMTTWDVKTRLLGRTVRPGQVLMQVVDQDGDWEVEVHMPEVRMGHILAARRELGEALPVTYILAVDPGARHQGTVEEVHLAAEVRGEEGNTVLIRLKIDKKDLPYLRHGGEVTARVHCGRRSIGYVWMHDLVDFIQSRILFRIW